jgi:hypothetical protein
VRAAFSSHLLASSLGSTCNVSRGPTQPDNGATRCWSRPGYPVTH